jgi:hypothetical protein
MWLIKVEHMPGLPHTDRQHFECQVCNAKAIIPPLE